MQVLKFGGTSVGSPERMRRVGELIDDGLPKIVVLSAVSGTTNKLVELSELIRKQQIEVASIKLAALREEYRLFVAELLPTSPFQEKGQAVVKGIFDETEQLLWLNRFESRHEKWILAQGEVISTQLFQLYMEYKERPSVLISALDFMRIDEHGEPDLEWIQKRLDLLLSQQHPLATYFITQGYICRNASDEVDNLQSY